MGDLDHNALSSFRKEVRLQESFTCDMPRGVVHMQRQFGTKVAVFESRPTPIIDDLNAFYWHGAAEEMLLFQRCTQCGGVRHPPALACPQASSRSWDLVESSGRGIIYSYSIPRRPLVPFIEDVVFVLVELTEGIRVLSNLLGDDISDIKIGDAVEVEFVLMTSDIGLPVFRRTSGERRMGAS